MKQFRRCISFLLTLCLILPMLPQPVRAAEETQIQEATVPEAMVEYTESVAESTVETTLPEEIQGTIASEESQEETLAPEAIEETIPEATVAVEETEVSEPQLDASGEAVPQAIYSGTCGDNLTWEYNSSNYTLTISGEGSMDGYPYPENPPWYDYINYIKYITIENGVTSIGDSAFPFAFQVSQIKLPKSVTRIERYAFAYCSGLTSVNLENLTYIGDMAFMNCDLKIVKIPSKCHVGNEAFSGNANLYSVIIPGDVGYLGYGVFMGTRSTSVSIGNGLTYIPNDLFGLCDMTRITLPESVISVGSGAFGECYSLRSISLPSKLESIGWGAFQGDTALTQISIPDGVKSIEEYTFNACTGLSKIELSANLTNIEKWAFARCTALKSIVIPEMVTTIGEKAFLKCSSLTEVTIPEAMTAIDANAFSECTKLADVYFGGSMSQWEDLLDGIAEGNECLLSAEVHCAKESVTESGTCGEDLRWLLDKETGVLSIRGTGAMYDYVRTSDIPWNAYHNAITSVVIREGATNICDYAFSDSFNLTSVAIPTSVTSIGEGAFSGCMKLAEVKLPENVILGNAAFRNCAAMSKLELPAGCSLGEDAFAGCSGLKSITIPATVQSISKGAFSECESLESVVIEEGITQIEAEMFAQCEALATITIPASVRSIGDGAFFECNQLQEIFYGSTQWQWESIQKNIGKNNERLTSVTNIHFTDEDRLVVFADHTNLCIRKGGTITLGSAVIKDKKHMKDVSGIVLLVNDPSILRVTGQTEENGFLYVTLSAQKEGTTVISFQDSITGFSSEIAVTVFTDNYHSYTLNGVPEQPFAGEVNNFYNYNGLYIDNYTAVVQDDGSATVSFDVYNRNQSSGVVEVYQADGKIYNGVLIEKQQDYNSSIKETMLDGPVGLIKDLYNGDLLTYRQSTNYTKHTHVEVEIPKDGYIRITNDPEASDIVAAVNILDVLMSIKEIAGDIKGYSKKSADFSKELTAELVKAKAKEVFGKDDFKFAKSMMKSVTKDIFFSSEALGDFAETVTKNLEEVNLGETLWNCTKKFGWGVGESTLLYFTGPCKAILTGLFTVSDIMNSLYQCLDLKRSIGVGFIEIQNQGGGIRHAKEVAVESENGFDDDVALNVFRVESHNHPKSLEYLQKYYPHLYESAKNSGEIYTYNISLQQGGKEVQPDGKVTVYIRIQNENMMISAAAGLVMIFREEKDGTLTEMDYKVENDCFVFTTDHFSLYTIRSFGEVGVTRLAGAARVDTAIEIAEQTKKELGIQKFQAMIYTVGKNFADALAGTSLAAQKKAPILLYSAKRDAYVRQYIQDNLAQGGTVYYLGGSDVMPEESAQALRSAGINVKRLEGKTRFQTNLAILQETGLKGGEILVCTSHSFADSLSASATGMPILLVRDTWTTLHKDVVDYLKTLTQPCTFHIIGGTAAVPAHLEEELKAYGTVDRIYGNTRYLTSVEVAKRFFPEADRAVLAVGSDFPDGLCGGPLAYAMGAPLILTKTGKESAAMAYTTSKGIHSGAVLGSNAENLVTDASAAKIFGVDVDQIGSK